MAIRLMNLNRLLVTCFCSDFVSSLSNLNQDYSYRHLSTPLAPLTPPHSLPLWNYSGYTRFPSFYFGASPGPQSSSELAYVRRNSLSGWGWQQGYKSNNGHHGEEAGAAAAAALRAIAPVGSENSPDATFVYRQSESLFTYYDIFANVTLNSSLLYASELHDPVSGKPCGGGGLLSFSNATFIDYWVNIVGGDIALEKNVDGVFLDGFDKLYSGNTLSSQGCPSYTPSLTASALLDKVAATAAFSRVLNAAGKVAIISTYNFLNASLDGLDRERVGDMNGVYEDAYISGLADTQWMRFYEVWLGHGADQDAAMISNAIRETSLGVPFVARSAVGSVHTLEYPAIGFLIAQGDFCYWGASSGWLDGDWKWIGIDDWQAGKPLSIANRTGTYSWSREFEHANATIDVHAGRATLTTFGVSSPKTIIAMR